MNEYAATLLSLTFQEFTTCTFSEDGDYIVASMSASTLYLIVSASSGDVEQVHVLYPDSTSRRNKISLMNSEGTVFSANINDNGDELEITVN